jgi:threonine/homoserine/homoserine lactone efflux protein
VPQALTSGFQAAFWVGAGIAAVGVVAALALIRKEELVATPAYEAEEEAEVVFEAAA